MRNNLIELIFIVFGCRFQFCSKFIFGVRRLKIIVCVCLLFVIECFSFLAHNKLFAKEFPFNYEMCNNGFLFVSFTHFFRCFVLCFVSAKSKTKFFVFLCLCICFYYDIKSKNFLCWIVGVCRVACVLVLGEFSCIKKRKHACQTCARNWKSFRWKEP